MKILAAILGTLVVLIQYPLWLGKGGWRSVLDIDRKVVAQREANDRLTRRNDTVAADVRDLKQGLDAVEERARYELGMIRGDEIFFQVVEPEKKETR